MRITVYFLLLSLIFISCGKKGAGDDSSEAGKEQTVKPADIPTEKKEEKKEIQGPLISSNFRYANIDKLRLRVEPSQDADVLTMLQKGDLLFWTGKQTDKKESIQIADKEVTAPWYEVEIVGIELKGWVFGAGLSKNIPQDLINNYEKVKLAEGVIEAGPFSLFGLSDGRLLSFKDNDEENEEFVKFEFDKVIKPESYYQIKGYGNEYHFWMILNPNNARLTYTWGPLEASESRQWFVTRSQDLTAGFVVNGFQVFRNTKDGLELAFEHEMRDFEPGEAIWQSDSLLNIIQVSPVIDSTISPEAPLEVLLDSTGWRIVI